MKTYVTLTPSISHGSVMTIDEMIDYLEECKKSLEDKTKIFLDRLLDVGINTATENTGKYGSYIHFSKRVEGANIGVLIATDEKIMSQWQTKKGVRGYQISPLLLAEFGSGFLAHVMATEDYRSNELDVGQGTMPLQKHAFDAKGWWWVDLDGVRHHSYGESPTYPMYSAVMAMLFEADFIAKEVFDG